MTKEQYVTAMTAVRKLIVDEYTKFINVDEVMQFAQHRSRTRFTCTSRHIFEHSIHTAAQELYTRVGRMDVIELNGCKISLALFGDT